MAEIKHGSSDIGLLFYGIKAPYFGRGAVKSLELQFDGYEGEFWLVKTSTKKNDLGEKIAKSTNKVLKAKDIPLEVRQETFAKTAQPYAQYGVTPEEYINLSAYERLEIEVEEPVNENDTFGKIVQEWSQIIWDEHTPFIRFPINLVQEEEYIPPQIRKEREEKQKQQQQEIEVQE